MIVRAAARLEALAARRFLSVSAGGGLHRFPDFLASSANATTPRQPCGGVHKASLYKASPSVLSCRGGLWHGDELRETVQA